ncbi:MAG: protein jag [Eubacterium sp.]|nr:protein jag [Eubacterium sp.]
MEYKEFRAKTVEDALIDAAKEFGVTTSDLETLIVDKGSTGFLGIGARQATVKARVKTAVLEAGIPERPAETAEKKPAAKKEEDIMPPVEEEDAPEEKPFVEKERPKSEPLSEEEKAELLPRTKEYLDKLFAAMELEAEVTLDYHDDGNELCIDVEGPDMGVLIGKRGQTLDALQYLISLYVNKNTKDKYIRVKLDTENYRNRRKETLENLAKNIAFKVKRTRRSFTLEPMNPYERRIIHSTLQNDKFVATRSEGEEPYRKVVVYLKKKDK